MRWRGVARVEALRRGLAVRPRELVGDVAKAPFKFIQAVRLPIEQVDGLISGKTTRSPRGLQTIGKMSLPSARAWDSSTKHHFAVSQFGVSTRMTAWQRDNSS